MKPSYLLKASVAAVCATLGLSSFAGAAAPTFTPGDVLVYRLVTSSTLVPTGGAAAVATLSANGNEVFLDEYTPTGTLVGSMDTNMVDAGNSSSHGLMTLSPDGKFIAVPGFANFNSGGLNNSNGSTDARMVRVYNSGDGSLFGSVSFTDATITSDYRGAVTDGTNVWISGSGTTGIRTNTISSPTATTSNLLTGVSNNYRGINIFGNQLYLSTNDAAKLDVVGSGAPSTATGQTLTALLGVVGVSPFQFVMFDLNGSDGILDTLYVADDTGATSGIEKFSLSGGTWILNGDFRASPAAAIRGLTGVLNGDGSVSLYATFANTSSNAGQTSSLYGYTDTTGYSGSTTGLTGTLTTLATINTPGAADTSTGAFRGVVILPGGGSGAVPEPASLTLLAIGAVALVRRRK